MWSFATQREAPRPEGQHHWLGGQEKMEITRMLQTLEERWGQQGKQLSARRAGTPRAAFPPAPSGPHAKARSGADFPRQWLWGLGMEIDSPHLCTWRSHL